MLSARESGDRATLGTLLVKRRSRLSKCGCRKLLVKAWKSEQKIGLQVADYCSVKPAASFNGMGKLGEMVQLLYCSFLFEAEPQRLLYSRMCTLEGIDGVKEEDLMLLVSAGRQIWESEKMPSRLPSSIQTLLDKVIHSSYFRGEDPARCSSVLQCLERLGRRWERKVELSTGRKRRGIEATIGELSSLGRDVLRLYSRKGRVHAWSDVFQQRSTFFGVGDPARVEQDRDLRELISAMKACPFTRLLMTCRPPNSVRPHDYSLLECMEHACLWVAKSELGVYDGISLSYSDLRAQGSVAGGGISRLLEEAKTRYADEVAPNAKQKRDRLTSLVKILY